MFIGQAPLTTVRLQGGRRANIAPGMVVPADADLDDVARLVDAGFLTEFEELAIDGELEVVEEPDAPQDEVLDSELLEQLLEGKVEDILDTVGDDASMAAVVLVAEEASSKPRATLVKGLREVIETDPGAGV